MSTYAQGYLATQQAGIEARNDITVAIRNWYANRNPLVTRLPYVPVERVDFQMYTHQYRARSAALGTNISSSSATTITLSDASNLMLHDVLKITDSATGNFEYVQITADPNTSANTIVVTRNVVTQGSSAALSSAATGSILTLVGNSRTGAEVNQTGLTTVGQARTQYCQTFQFPVQVGGSAQTARAAVMPGGVQSPFDFNMTMQLQNMVDDIENSCYIGVAQAPVDSTGVTAKMNGIFNILATNNTTSPTNAASYGPTDLIRDTLQAARTGGGEPDYLFVSTNWMSAFAAWGQAIQRIPSGETSFGTPIVNFEAPFLHGVTIVEAPLLAAYSAFAITSSEVYIRPKRNPYWNLRGNRGDMVEGEWLAEMAIEVVNEAHHAAVSGVTAFGAN